MPATIMRHDDSTGRHARQTATEGYKAGRSPHPGLSIPVKLTIGSV